MWGICRPHRFYPAVSFLSTHIIKVPLKTRAKPLIFHKFRSIHGLGSLGELIPRQLAVGSLFVCPAGRTYLKVDSRHPAMAGGPVQRRGFRGNDTEFRLVINSFLDDLR